jgi:ferredoxin-NADP reductase
VRELTLAPLDEPFTFVPGQWIGLHLPVGEKPPLVRAYSFAAPPSPSGELTLCLDRVPEGLGSEYLFSLGPGEPLTFAGPLGNFVLPEGGGDLLWLARYTGIVPFRAMLLHLEAHPTDGTVTLVYSAAREDDLAYHGEIMAAAERLPWLELLSLVDDPDAEADEGAGAVLERLPRIVGEHAALTPMICGKREFVRPLRDYFYGLGYDRKTVKWENYD